jgi:hypothetical protein
MKRRWLYLGAALLLTTGLLWGFIYAQEMARAKSTPVQGTDVTLHGQVIDVSCWVGHGLKGKDHKKCAEVCSQAGIPLAILADNGSIYFPVSADMPGKAQNEKLVAFAEENVVVKGTTYDRNGFRAIIIDSVERAKLAAWRQGEIGEPTTMQIRPFHPVSLSPLINQ